MDIEKLQQHTDLLMQNISGFENNAISAIMQRIEKIGKLNSADKKALENLSRWTATDTQAITKMMAQELSKSIPEVESILSEALKDTADSKADLYEYQGIAQTAFADDKRAQAIIQSFANQTGETMINLSKTKALNLVSPDGITRPFATSAQQILDQAVFAVTSGTEDFYSAMRGAISKMGGGGVRIDYGGGVSRRLDTVIRQNILYATKMANTEYDREISDELGCDGIEVSYHSNPRPSHEFMGGKQFAKGKAKTVNGVRYESDSKAQQAMSEYGCLHDEYGIILGVSEPAIDKDELERLKAHDSEMVEYNGRTMSRYEWKQYQRQLETKIRYAKDSANTAKASGDMAGRKIEQNRINTLQARYDDMTDKVGLQQTKERQAVANFSPVKGTKDVKLRTYTPKTQTTELSENAKLIIDVAKTNKVEFNQVSNLKKQLSAEEIINKLAGGDMTKGSCSSLGFCYIGNKNGFDVTDFRGGSSQEVFSRQSTIQDMLKLPNVKGSLTKVKVEARETLGIISKLDRNKEYYLSTGRHAAIINVKDTGLEYLEMQSSKKNGWMTAKQSGFKNDLDLLIKRFGCRKTVDKDRYTKYVFEKNVVVMEVDSFKNNSDFQEVLGYINTNTDKQKKGVAGYAK